MGYVKYTDQDGEEHILYSSSGPWFKISADDDDKGWLSITVVGFDPKTEFVFKAFRLESTMLVFTTKHSEASKAFQADANGCCDIKWKPKFPNADYEVALARFC